VRGLGDAGERGVPRDLIRGAIEAVHQRRAGGARVVPARAEVGVLEQ
jgi:hypothetical protein